MKVAVTQSNGKSCVFIGGVPEGLSDAALAEMAREALDHSWRAAAGPWISVEERLPQTEVLVKVKTDAGDSFDVGIPVRNDDGSLYGWMLNFFPSSDVTVTHWAEVHL